MKKHFSRGAPPLLLVLLCLFFWAGCNKDDPAPTKQDPCPWPDITTQGLHTFGCKINGKEWVPCVDLNGLAVGTRPIDCTVRESDGSNFLSVVISYSMSSVSDTLATLILGLKPLTEGNINLSTLDYSSFEFRHIYSTGQSSQKWTQLDTSSQNYFSITRLDTSKNIISGVFDFTLFSDNNQHPLHFSNGRFDFTYYQQ